MSSESKTVGSSQEAEVASVDSDSIRVPLPVGIDDLPSFEDASNELTPPGGADDGSISECPDFESSDLRKSSQVGDLDPSEKANLRAMIGDSSFGIGPTLKFKFPWERKGIANILQKDRKPIMPVPVLPVPILTALPSESAHRDVSPFG